MRVANISGLTKPASIAPIIKRAQQYLDAMRDMGRPVSHVAIQPKHYDALMASINKGKAANERFDGLCIGDGVAVTRGGA